MQAPIQVGSLQARASPPTTERPHGRSILGAEVVDCGVEEDVIGVGHADMEAESVLSAITW